MGTIIKPFFCDWLMRPPHFAQAQVDEERSEDSAFICMRHHSAVSYSSFCHNGLSFSACPHTHGSAAI